jgi:hypothetical protein
MGPIGIDSDSRFITSLIADLYNKMCLDIDLLANLARNIELHVVSANLVFTEFGGGGAGR